MSDFTAIWLILVLTLSFLSIEDSVRDNAKAVREQTSVLKNVSQPDFGEKPCIGDDKKIVCTQKACAKEYSFSAEAGSFVLSRQFCLKESSVD